VFQPQAPTCEGDFERLSPRYLPDLSDRIESSGYESEPITSGRTFVGGYPLVRVSIAPKLGKALEFLNRLKI